MKSDSDFRDDLEPPVFVTYGINWDDDEYLVLELDIDSGGQVDSYKYKMEEMT